MNLPTAILNSLLLGLVCILPSGCLLRPAKITTRQFILSAARMESPSAGQSSLSIGLGAIKLPDYLRRSAMAVRRGEGEIEYLENALWAERLDHSFQRALAANLRSQLPGGRVQLSAWQVNEVTAVVFISVDRFDVTAEGRGTLAVRWQVETPDRRQVLRTGEDRFEKSGPPPHATPEVVAVTLSELTAQFAGKLVQEIRAAAPAVPAGR